MLQEYWGSGRGGVKLEKITELPELMERPQPFAGRMSGNRRQSNFRDGFERERGMYQRNSERDRYRSGYGGKESFRKDFIHDRYGGRESYSKGSNSDSYSGRRKSDFSFHDNKSEFDDFDDWPKN